MTRKIKNIIIKLLRRIKSQSFYIVFFTLAFSIMGAVIPETYFRYFDKTEYYKIDLPVDVEKEEYHSCDVVVVNMRRTSLKNLIATAVVELQLVRETDGAKQKVYEETRSLAIEAGTLVLSTQYVLPCNLIPGMYFYEGIIEYTVNGVDKATRFETETFKIVN